MPDKYLKENIQRQIEWIGLCKRTMTLSFISEETKNVLKTSITGAEIIIKGCKEKIQKERVNMAQDLERMKEVWLEKFNPYIEAYEPMYFILDPDADITQLDHEDSEWYWDWFGDYKSFFRTVDNMYARGFRTLVIISLTIQNSEFDVEGYFLKEDLSE